MLHSTEAIERIDALQAELLRQIPETGLSVRGSELYLNFLMVARELINHYSIAAVLEARLQKIAMERTAATDVVTADFKPA